MATKHTKGPFKAERNYRGTGCYVMQPEQGRVLAVVNEREAGIEREECAANAGLFAAAPDLLAACKAFLNWPSPHTASDVEEQHDIVQRARAAIRKAEGN